MSAERPSDPSRSAAVHGLMTAVAQLPGVECWSLINGNGSRVSLDFGPKVPRDPPVNNPHLSDVQRNYVGEVSLFIECPWTISRQGHTVADWRAREEVMDAALNAMAGSVVQVASIDPDTYELTLGFSGGWILRIDNLQRADGLDGYTFFSPTKTFTATADEVIVLPR